MLNRIRIHFELLFVYLAQFIKTRLEYKADFFLGLFSRLLFQGVSLIFIDVMFAERTLTLNGWTKAQVFFIYGFSILPLTLFMAFFSNLYMVGGTYIVEGNLDRILLRPLNTLFQVLLEKVNIEALFGAFVGIAIMIISSRHIGLEWDLFKLLLVVLLTLCGTVIYAGVFTSLASVSFWWPDRMGLLPPVYNMITFGKYPVTIYNNLLQFILTWIIPFAFVAFFPSTHFLLEENKFKFYVLLVPVMALTSATIGYTIWHLGIRRYESTGS